MADENTVTVQMRPGTASVSYEGVPLTLSATGKVTTSLLIAHALMESHGAYQTRPDEAPAAGE